MSDLSEMSLEAINQVAGGAAHMLLKLLKNLPFENLANRPRKSRTQIWHFAKVEIHPAVVRPRF